VLNRTFVHIPRIGAKTEQRLWACGLTDWHEALAHSGCAPGFSSARWADACDHIQSSLRSLRAGDHAYFSTRLPCSEHWRAFSSFRKRTGYLDIETTGLGPRAGITVIGLYDGKHTATYIAGDNFDEFPHHISSLDMIVTFNGLTFDLPYLRRAFPQVEWDHLHCDLRYALGRLGLHGGLKNIEGHLGIARADDITDLSGDDAVRLWYEYLAGNEDSLARLVEYNTADVENLEALMHYAYDHLLAQLIGVERR
jgi:uncharacterized protein